MISLDGAKMSKSLGNLSRVRELRAQGGEPSVIRLGLAAGHYRQDRSWSDAVLDEARTRAGNWRRAVDRGAGADATRSEEHTSELQSRFDLVCRLLLEKKKKNSR